MPPSLLRSPKTPEPEAKKRLIDLFKWRTTPLLIGEAALLLGAYWTLDHTEALLNSMVSDGMLRRATVEESRDIAYLPV